MQLLILFWDSKKILKEIDEEAGDEDSNVDQHSEPQVEGLQLQHPSVMYLMLSEVSDKLASLKIKKIIPKHVPQAEGL